MLTPSVVLLQGMTMTKFWDNQELPVYDKTMDLKQMKLDLKEAEATKGIAKV